MTRPARTNKLPGRGDWLGIVACVLGVLSHHHAALAAPLRLTLPDAIARATAANANLNETRKGVEVANANLERGKAWLPANPYITGGAQHSDNFGPNYSVLVSQEFEVAGQRGIRIDAATQNVAKANWEAKGAEFTLVATVQTTFVQALVNADRVTLAERGVEAAHDLADQLRGRKVSSIPDQIDLNVSEMQETRARRDLAAARHTYTTSLDALHTLLAIPADEEIELVGTPESNVRELPPLPQLLERAHSQRADLAAMRHDLQRADAQLDLAERERVPNVTVTGTFSRYPGGTTSPSGTETVPVPVAPGTFIGGEVTIPIPIFNDKTAEVHEATAERDRAGLRTQNLEAEIEKEVREAHRTCVVNGDNLQVQQREIVPKSEENLQLERRLYERGQVSAADVVGAQVDLLTAQRDHLEALENYNTALIELDRLVGGGLVQFGTGSELSQKPDKSAAD